MESIILAGMPGCGKSTTGVILAKMMGMQFIDTDLLVQQQERALLQEILDVKGAGYFLKAEEKCILSNTFENMVVATGGSVICSQKAVDYLKTFGKIYFLDLSYKNIQSRIHNLSVRGVVMTGGTTLQDVYNTRFPLYRDRCDIRLDCNGLASEEVAARIADLERKC